ncbi:MAG: FKBP-type peptidyl-prolyl cis-trans isomerase [Bacteroidales bacterium]|nr:FKBP-type peptidyl-prolyl cis-trans isomerase [Bacteroidales bacterium]MCF8391675.1 FKBP-type peptidyl-prolyl cis-trans isomerase [Bacteroidales bacterium]
MIRFFFACYFIFQVSSCSYNKSEYFKEISPELFFHLYTIGEDKEKVHSGDYVTLHFSYKTIADSVFFEGKRKFKVENQTGPGSIIPAMLIMSEGDSACIKIKTRDFFNYTLSSEVPEFLNSESYILIDLKINEIQSPADFEREKLLFFQWLDEYHTTESQLISDYLLKENIQLSPTESGLFFISLKPGNGKRVQPGRRVWIHYTGRFLNGRFVDNSNSLTNPVDYIYGTEMFLIEGLEEALGRMSEHEKALVILPSKLAFGSFGTADKVVPPYTTLIYEIEVVKVD